MKRPFNSSYPLKVDISSPFVKTLPKGLGDKITKAYIVLLTDNEAMVFGLSTSLGIEESTVEDETA